MGQSPCVNVPFNVMGLNISLCRLLFADKEVIRDGVPSTIGPLFQTSPWKERRLVYIQMDFRF